MIKYQIKNRKRLMLIFAISTFLAIISPAFSQQGKVPPFRIIDANKNLFKAEDLPFEKPIMIVYFLPECEDCQLFINALLSKINNFRNVSIVMITYSPVEILRGFSIKNSLNKYSNIYAGTEMNTLFVRDYYNIGGLPFISLYTKNGDLIRIYNNENYNLDTISRQLNNP
jgi:thiol-disulfide isomerase/thioredoxin